MSAKNLHRYIIAITGFGSPINLEPLRYCSLDLIHPIINPVIRPVIRPVFHQRFRPVRHQAFPQDFSKTP